MDSLPEELTTHIFQYLPATDIARLEHLNRYHGSIVRRNRSVFKNPNISVIYSVNGMKEMEFKVVSSDIGTHWKNGKILRKVTVQDQGRIVVVHGGDGEFPEGGQDEEGTVSIVFHWLKENIAALYSRWGRCDISGIPELVLDAVTSPSHFNILFRVIIKEKCTIGVLRFVDCDLRRAHNFIRDSRSIVGRLRIENNIYSPSDGIVHAAQNSNDCRIYARIDLVLSLISSLKWEWHHIKHRCGTPWTVTVVFRKENSDEDWFGKILDGIQSSEDSDFQVTMPDDYECGQKVVTIKGIKM